MKVNNIKLNNSVIYDVTTRNLSHIKELKHKIYNFDKDKSRVARLSQGLCKYCYYINNKRVGGATIVTTNCSICNKELKFPNTAIDKLCFECSEKYGLCKHCGGDIELKHKGKRWLQ